MIQTLPNKISYYSYPGIVNIGTSSIIISDKIEAMVFVTRVCKVLNAPINKVLSDTRKSEIMEVRHICMYLIKNYLRLKSKNKTTLKFIGDIFGRDHSAIIYSLKVCKNWIDTNKSYREKFEKVVEELELTHKYKINYKNIRYYE